MDRAISMDVLRDFAGKQFRDVVQVDYEYVRMFDAYVRRDGEIFHGRGLTIDEALMKARAALVPAPVTFLQPWGGSLTEFAPQ